MIPTVADRTPSESISWDLTICVGCVFGICIHMCVYVHV